MLPSLDNYRSINLRGRQLALKIHRQKVALNLCQWPVDPFVLCRRVAPHMMMRIDRPAPLRLILHQLSLPPRFTDCNASFNPQHNTFFTTAALTRKEAAPRLSRLLPQVDW